MKRYILNEITRVLTKYEHAKHLIHRCKKLIQTKDPIQKVGFKGLILKIWINNLESKALN